MAHVLHLLYLCLAWVTVNKCSSSQPPIFDIRAENRHTITVFYSFQHDLNDSDIFLYFNDHIFFCNTTQILDGERIGHYIVNVNRNLESCSNETKQCFFETKIKQLGFYCAQLAFNRHLYNSKTIKIPPDPIPDQAPKTPSESSQTFIWITCCIVLSTIAIIVCIIYNYIKPKLQKKSLTTTGNDTQKPHRVPYQPISEFIQIFVLYHNDSEQHYGAVQKFVNQLEEIPNCEVVVDYKCKNEICKLGMASWVSKVLTTAKRIIVISSEGAYSQVILRNNRKTNPNTSSGGMETAFLFGWISITSDPNLVSNYNKLFNIRFEYTDSRFLLPYIVSGRHFQIPSYYKELVFQLFGSKELATQICTNLNSTINLG